MLKEPERRHQNADQLREDFAALRQRLAGAEAVPSSDGQASADVRSARHALAGIARDSSPLLQEAPASSAKTVAPGSAGEAPTPTRPAPPQRARHTQAVNKAAAATGAATAGASHAGRDHGGGRHRDSGRGVLQKRDAGSARALGEYRPEASGVSISARIGAGRAGRHECDGRSRSGSARDRRAPQRDSSHRSATARGSRPSATVEHAQRGARPRCRRCGSQWVDRRVEARRKAAHGPGTHERVAPRRDGSFVARVSRWTRARA